MALLERIEEQYLELLEAEDYYQSETSLFHFFQAAWSVLEPGRPIELNWHQELICEYLELVSHGTIKRLLINIAPRSLKSTLVTICWPCWEWLQHPGLRYLCLSYAQTLATDHSKARRKLIQSDWYQRGWGERFYLAGDHNLKTQFENNYRGLMFSASVGGVLGFGGDRLIVDDPHNPEQAESNLQRASTIGDFDDATGTRLNDPKSSAIVVVMQRLHYQDISGHVLADVGGYEHLCLPTEAEERTTIVFPHSGRKQTRQPGEFLHPLRFGPQESERAKRTLGSYKYAGRYQQRPTPAEGGLFKRHWWQFYANAPPLYDLILMSWDCTFKGKDTSDFVVGQVWGKLGPNCYLLDQVRDRMGIELTLRAIEAQARKWPDASAKLVEDAANGPAVIELLRRKVPGLLAVQPQGGKEVRANAILPYVEAGNVFIPNASVASWAPDFIEECASFPLGTHDDQVDAMTQALTYLFRGYEGEPLILELDRVDFTGY